ncbi:cytochrome c [Hasllibacter halocynthiae]|uniref:Cytochrome c n=1 Tax=Hasllibacter halocynthiae TaxID=595589 RepID=A0A2T0X409_9RHOB|nr:c-type cytochrome [Hasllibacter halocynthiae]PRY93683.1 cytochrome c [Hasllibacter halocynthiae]
MFDTMTLTKLVGGFCGALLIFLLGGWAAETLYHTGGDHYGDEVHQAYVIPLPDAGAEEEAVEEVAFDVVYASADADAGGRIWNQCRACHAMEPGVNGTGPTLAGIVGREQAAVSEYAYSSAFAELDGVWTPENLSHFLENPSGWVPGTKMTYSGIGDVEDRANIIAWLEAEG